jgi:hypothetical protein
MDQTEKRAADRFGVNLATTVIDQLQRAGELRGHGFVLLALESCQNTLDKHFAPREIEWRIHGWPPSHPKKFWNWLTRIR